MSTEWLIYKIGTNDESLTSAVLDVGYYDTDQWRRLCSCLAINEHLRSIQIEYFASRAEYDVSEEQFGALANAMAAIPSLNTLEITGIPLSALSALFIPRGRAGAPLHRNGRIQSVPYRCLRSIELSNTTEGTISHQLLRHIGAVPGLRHVKIESPRPEEIHPLLLHARELETLTVEHSVSLLSMGEDYLFQDRNMSRLLEPIDYGCTSLRQEMALTVLDLDTPISLSSMLSISQLLTRTLRESTSGRLTLRRFRFSCDGTKKASREGFVSDTSFLCPTLVVETLLRALRPIMLPGTQQTDAANAAPTHNLLEFRNYRAIDLEHLAHEDPDLSTGTRAERTRRVEQLEEETITNNFMLERYALFRQPTEKIKLHLKLNEVGRKRLFREHGNVDQSEEGDLVDDQRDVVAQIILEQRDDLDCLYYFLRQCPVICQVRPAASENSDLTADGASKIEGKGDNNACRKQTKCSRDANTGADVLMDATYASFQRHSKRLRTDDDWPSIGGGDDSA